VLASAGIEAQIAEENVGVVVRAAQSDAPAALAALRDSDFDFVMLLDLFGTDTGERIEMTYHLRSLARDEEIYVRCGVEYDGQLQSVWNVYPSALLPERETAELLGLMLSGHPNPKRLLTTDGVAPLLRKSVPIRTAEEVRAR
jgi:NADH-quinone oxidoreductase subunit C